MAKVPNMEIFKMVFKVIMFLGSQIFMSAEGLFKPYLFSISFENFRDTFREAFKRKKRKYIDLLPILGGGEYPLTYIFPGFS